MTTGSSGKGSIRFCDDTEFTGVKVFSTTMMADRARLGDTITHWIRENPTYEVREITVTQSSDEAYHCLTMTLFYFDTDTDTDTD